MFVFFKNKNSYTEPADYTNHSCDPNAGFGDSPISLVAMRYIEVDEEITFDYAMSDCIENITGNSDWDCVCGAKNCRGRFTGADWRIPALWERYGSYFSPYILKKINYLRNQQGLLAIPTFNINVPVEFPSVIKYLNENEKNENQQNQPNQVEIIP